MNGILTLGVIAVLAGIASAANAASATSPAQPFAVIELFTSEGCSSCLTADQLLNEIAADAKKNNQRIFPLAFHVDYWNYLGWIDPFSSPSFSDRQQVYAKASGTERIYTPQMIVNGAEEFVGSDRAQAERAMTDALSRPSHVAVTLRPHPWNSGDALVIDYDVQGASGNDVLNIALVESGLVRKVARGENAGRTLHHDNVVRGFVSVNLAAGSNGQVTIHPPAAIAKDQAQVIGFVQEPGTMRILGAASATIN